MADLSVRPVAPASSPTRRLIAAGIIRRLANRTISVRVTEAGVTGTIKTDRATRVAELHRLCREDYTGSADRRTQDHRDDAFLIARASEAVAAR
uniref:Uncharacterized protein n=1 Tax=Streptomyces sp. NBC_00093 TaxID=2975649 RepID=A0AAU2A1I0_9ACTN